MDNSEVRLKSGVLSLNPVNGQLGYEKSKHLLNRCMFGARLSEIEFMQNKTAEEAVDFLLRESAETLSPPLSAKNNDDEVPVGTTWINTKYNGKYRGQRIYSYICWWIGRLIHQDLSLVEKMTIFWHNHFVIENDVVRNTNFNYHYNILIYNEALGNFKELTKQMTINVGMLKYLNGDQNVTGAANENYARELLELFTIGKGPLTEPGNYTNYTEQDIREAAKVLTGWRTNSDVDQSYFTSSKHDKSTKTFSEIFNNQVIQNNEENEYIDLIEMIFSKKETARFLVRKLYRWFVYHEIDEEIEQNIISPLTELFSENNFEIKPLLKKLLCSEHFFDENYRGCLIKNPLEFTIGMLRQLEFDSPDNSDIIKQYGFWNKIFYYAKIQDMEIGNPPDVAGWPAWYLEPMYNELWINAATIPNKSAVTKSVISYGISPLSGYDKIYLDPFKVVYLANDPSDINDLIPTLTGLLFPLPATEDQINELKEVLIPGLPDFEWTAEWNKYISNPDDENQKNAVSNSIKKLLIKICSMGEYQLI
ncbi:MAG TPA: DUF1800 domain-containing protein [Draconibacterium sp.]|nr:DUF1800 domain-containing protein [Draconibacterium sp.]